MTYGSCGVTLSNSKTIRQESVRSIVLRVESRVFHWVGHVCRTSNVDIAEGDYAKSSTML